MCGVTQSEVHLHCYQWKLVRDLKLCDYALNVTLSAVTLSKFELRLTYNCCLKAGINDVQLIFGL